jgi:predicted Fe-Mo cluster-binding NifX family protein
MRIAISAQTNDGLESIVAQHFGRCPYFAFVEVQDNEIKSVEMVENPFLAGHQVGQVPNFIHNQKADVMLSGGMGGRAIQFFKEFEIGVSTGASGNVEFAVSKYLAGELNEAAPCAESVEHGHGGGHHHHHGHS